jgi:hypothetical protein
MTILCNTPYGIKLETSAFIKCTGKQIVNNFNSIQYDSEQAKL